jgi:hypothetical protein
MEEQLTTHPEAGPESGPQPPRAPRARRAVVPAATFLLGIVVGALLLLLYALSIGGGAQMLAAAPKPRTSAITLQVGPDYISHLFESGLRSSGLGSVSNVSVILARGDQMTIRGEDQVLLALSRPFTIVVQPYVSACRMQVRILHADISGIALTAFARTFEQRINQQLDTKPGDLPSGFVYCQTSVSTQPQALIMTYSAQPV